MSIAADMRNIGKAFGAVRALEGVSLEVESGSIHAVVGENGAGKTTLMRILYGALQPDGGEVRVDGAPVRFRRSADAIRAGVGMVSQHYGIIPQLTCLENLMLGAEPGPVVFRQAAARRAEELAAGMGFSFQWNREASDLSPAGAQKLEILKLLWRRARIMILDEPTAMLSPADGEALFASLAKLASEGATIILVTHRLPEVVNYCRHVTVLRASRVVADTEVKSTDATQLAEWIIGHSPTPPPALEPPAEAGAALEIRELRAHGQRGEEALKGVSLSLRKGEMLGIAGVDGSGQRELFQTILGLLKPTAGSIFFEGVDVGRKSLRDRIAKGLRLIPEDRHAEGLVPEWSLAENAALGLQRLPPFARGPWIDVAARAAQAERSAARFDTKYGGLGLPVLSLSGGNQQRFVAGRALSLDPRLILAFQPARGLDIEAARTVYDALRQACRDGAAVLVVSYDLDELLENCDRIVAMRSGNVFEPPKGLERDRAAIGGLMVGGQ